ncbi:phosphopantetheine-binding protein [Microbacterium sp. 18062]|uniref:phosphopantetheine-binding protein n=1 Tax=Microbacterium sp. 18062 TaxID=2681410 RepID=UPI0013587246|nr:phosphopantetheine-binding protein [Microbacterium sp. 18062]
MTLRVEQAEMDVADVLYIEATELDHESDLRDQGMDSVRIMELVEKWRRAGVARIDYIVLAEDQRLSRWLDVLESLQDEGAPAA